MLSLTWSYMGFNLNLFKKFMEEEIKETTGEDVADLGVEEAVEETEELNDATEEATPATEEEATEEETEDTE